MKNSASSQSEILLNTAAILKQKILENILAAKDKLFEQGHIPSGNENILQLWIKQTVDQYEQSQKLRNAKASARTDHSNPEHQKMALLLHLAGITQTIILTDWSVERGAETSAQSLGLKSFSALERVLVRKYTLENFTTESVAIPTAPHAQKSPPLHIHKGPGNGQLMADLRNEQTGFTEVGIGDKLYFSLESTIRKFMHREKRGDVDTEKFIDFVGQALRAELKKRWYKNTEENTLLNLEQKADFCDLNEVFDILAHPQEWIDDFLKHEHGHTLFKVGGEFDQDTLEILGEKVYELFQIYLGELSPKQIKNRLNNSRHTRKKAYGKRLHELNIRRRSLRRSGKNQTEDGVSLGEMEKEIREIEKKIKRIKVVSRAIKAEHEFLEFINDDTPLSPTQFCARLFSNRFTSEITQAHQRRTPQSQQPHDQESKNPLNLNAHADVAPTGFIPGWFSDMPRIFAPGSAMLITGVRSDSHEDHEAFAADIAANIDLLAPGGMIVTDGFRQSYTRIERWPELQKALRGRKDISMQVAVDTKTGKALSLVIQKKDSTRGALTRDEKRQCFEDHAELRSIEEVQQDPFRAISNDVRREVYEKNNHNPAVFKNLHDPLEEQLAAVLREVGPIKPQSPISKAIRSHIFAALGQS